ncbi:hypothetical protein D3C76_861740 [compost metagenome]
MVVEGTVGVGRRLDQQLIHVFAPVEIADIEAHVDGNAMARILGSLIFLPGDRLHGEAHRLILQIEGQGALGGVAVTVDQLGADDLAKGGGIVIEAGPRREAVVAVLPYGQGSHHLLAVRAHHI